jgi:P-type E1-E2 ATPase
MGTSLRRHRGLHDQIRYLSTHPGFEDYQRYKSDKELNHELTTQIYRNGQFVQVEWSQVIIGDIVKVEAEELFPVDLILISSSVEGGVAFIETASLDG